MIIAKYKFDRSIYTNLIPVFNDGYTGYSINDIVDENNSNHIIRTIECDTLPSFIKFGFTNHTPTNTEAAASSLIELLELNISGLTNLTHLFCNCNKLTSVNTSNWDTSGITTMNGMFDNCQSLTSIDVSNFDTSNVTNMNHMFKDCQSLTSLDVSNFDTSNVNYMDYMFDHCINLTSLDVSNFDTSNVTNMDYMFDHCINLTSLDVSNWDTSSVINMSHMFNGCQSLTSLDVSKWDTSKVYNVNMMFAECRKLTSIDVSNWDTSRIDGYQAMFFNNVAMTEIDLSGFNTVSAIDMGSFLGDMINVKVMNLCNLNATIERVTYFNSNRFMQNCNSLEKVYINELYTLASMLELNVLPDRTGKEPGYIVTTLRDQIDEETLAALTVKNWVVKDLVTQYVYDANTYENLIPEFNAEFTSDKYEIYDSVSDIVIDDIVWTPGCITNTGENAIIPVEFPNAVRTDSYLPILDNVSYKSNFDLNYSFYDENKNHISTTHVVENTYIVSPINAKYVRLYRGTLENTVRVTAKIITRSIESKNGDLPTLMRFGTSESVTDRSKSLLKLLSLNTNNLNILNQLCMNCKRVTEINTSNWDTSNVTSMISTFYNCALLSKLDVSKFDVSKVESLNLCFNGCNSLTEIDVSNWKTTEVLNDISNLFDHCYLIKKLDLSGFNTSNVFNFTNLFCDCHELEEIEGLYSFDTSNAELFQGLFARCHKLQHINGIENWNTSKVTNFHYVFADEQIHPRVGIDITNWNLANSDYYTTFLSNLTNLRYLKCDNTETINKLIPQLPTRTADKPGYIVCRTGAANLDTTALNDKNWKIIKYLVADYTFDKTIHNNPIPLFNDGYTGYTIVDGVDSTNANHVNRIIVSNTLPTKMRFGNNDSNATSVRCMVRIDRLDCSALSDAYLMFKHCVNLTGIYTRFNVTENLSTVDGMFGGCTSIKNLDVTGLISSNVTTMIHLFDGCVNLSSIKGMDTWDTSGSTSMRCLFEDCMSLTSLDVSNFKTSNVTDMKGMFGGVDSNYMSLTEIKGLENFNTSNVEDMSYMFCRCNKLTEINVSNFDTSSVNTIEGMFMNCESVTSLDVGHFNVSNVTNLWAMFASCNKIHSLDVSKWDTSNVIYMAKVFNLCSQLRSLDVSNWDVGKVTNLESCFAGCTNLPKLDVSRWNTSNVINMANVTQNLYKATSLDLNNWDTSKAYNIGGTFDDLGMGVSTPKKIDLSNWDTSSATFIGWLFYSSDAITNGWKYNIQELNITNMDLSKVINAENFISPIYAETLENPIIRCNVVDTIKMIAEYLPSRASLSTPGYIVTTMKDEIDEPTVELLTGKNWLIREMIAQYVFDANTYEDLMPEFNPEFTEDKYEVYDSVSDIVIDNIQWEPGAIDGDNGNNVSHIPGDIDANLTCIRFANFISVVPNVEYKCVDSDDGGIIFDWYDENKVFIKQEHSSSCVAPLNAKYMRAWTGKENTDVYLTSKIVTRTIESKNGELPTLMRFGYGKEDLTDSNIPKHLSLIKILGLNTKELTTAFRMFKYCRRLSTVQSNWNTSKITDMFAMFFECVKLTSIDVSNWDTSNVIEMHGLFNGCNSLTSLDVSNWDVRKVTRISQMFLACTSLKSMDLSNWQTDSLEQMYRLFQGCHNLVSVNINNLNISKVQTLEETFKDCHRLASLDLSNWDTSSINNIRHMFTACRALTSLDLNNWDTSNVTYMDSAFYNCENLVSVNISDWDTSKVTYMHSLFHNCKKLTTVDVSRWNVGNVIRMDNLFNSCNELVSIDVSNWNTSNVQNMGCLFGWCFKLQSVDLSNWDTSKVEYMSYMFSECNELTSIGDTSNWDTGNVTNMEWMFDKCYKLSSLNVSNWDTSNVTDMTYMFNGCISLTSLDVSKWDTGNVRGMRNTFNNCRSLTSLDVNNWDVSKVGETYAMFSDCVSLTGLDLTNWNMSKVNNIGYMFDGKELGASINMPILDLTSLDWSLVTVMEGLFYKNNAKVIKMPRIINPNLLSVISKRDDGSYGLFYCPNLISLDFGGLNLSNLSSFDIDNKHLILEHVPKLRYIRTENAALIADLAQYFPARTEAEQGYLITKANVSDEIRGALSAKYWNVVDLDEVGTLIAKYKFSANGYKNNVPIFNSQFVDFFIEDEIENENEPNIITRSIFSINDIPTSIQFGVHWISERYEIKHYPRTESLRAVEYLNTSRIVSTNNMFRHCRNVTNINTSNWETGNFTDLNSTFENCTRLTSLDVSGWITDKVTTMEDMFRGCENLKTINGIENWNTDKVTTMMGMFQHCKVLSSINLSNFDTRNVNNMSNMFFQCHVITSLDVSNFDTSNVTYMNHMFFQCYNLTSIDVSNWNTSKVENMAYMFSDCRSLTSLDVSNFDTRNVTTMAYMFYNCNKLTSLDVSNFDTGKVNNIGFMFQGCHVVTSLDVSNFDTSKVTNMQETFKDCHSLTSLDVSKWNTSKVTSAHQLFGICKNLTSIDVSNFDTSNMIDIAGMFWHCLKLEYIDVSGWNIEQVGLWDNGLNHIFFNCVSLKQLDLSSFKTINCKNIGGFISSCVNLEYLDISNFDLHLIEKENMSAIEDIAKLANIGMIYCDFKTVEKVASAIQTTNPTTIWVGNHIDFNALPQYDHIMYKVYEVEDKLEVELSSPLLEGDRLEIIDGDLYHYHKMGIYNLANKNEWYLATDQPNDTTLINVYRSISGMKLSAIVSSDRFIFGGHKCIDSECLLTSDAAGNIHIIINKSKLMTEDEKGVRDWLQVNPVTIVYELANPYYELVKPNVGLLNAEQGLYLNISDSVVPVVNHQDLCTLKLNYLLPNVEYKVKFKANNSGSIAINLGGTLVPLDVVEGWNEVMVTTPETLVDEYLKVNGSEGIKIQNVMVIDSNKDFDYFKGMNNTFDEIPVKNICTNRTLTYTHGVDEEGVSPQGEMNVNVSKGKVVTVLGRVSNNPDNLPISINLYNDTGRATGKNLFNPEMYKNVPMANGTCTLTPEGSLIVRPNQIAPDTFIDNYMNIGVGAGSVGKPISDDYKKYLIPVNGGGLYTLSTIIPDWYNTKGGFSSYDAYVQCYDSNYTLLLSDTYLHTGFIGRNLIQDKGNHDDAYYYTQFNLPANTAYVLCRLDVNAGIETTTFTNILFEKGETAYEPFRNHVNDEPVYIDSNNTTALVDESLVDLSATDGYFVTTIRADRDYANRIGFNVGDASSCEANDQVTITDLMVFEGDILDCHPTTYVDPADTRYLVEYKSIGNPFGFGKNKLI